MRETSPQPSTQEKLQQDIDALTTLLDSLRSSYHLSFDDALLLLKGNHEKKHQTLIPSSIFLEKKLGIMESVVKYLKEDFSLTFHQIAVLLNRDDRVVWTTYNNAIKKKKEHLHASDPQALLPLSIFSAKTHGPLEAIVVYLKDNASLSFNQIAKLLGRDNRVVWAVYNKKRKTNG